MKHEMDEEEQMRGRWKRRSGRPRIVGGEEEMEKERAVDVQEGKMRKRMMRRKMRPHH